MLVPATIGATLSATATLLGVGCATVARLQVRFWRSHPGKVSKAGSPRRNWGGRRNALLTVEEEREFLAPWLEQARAGGAPVVSPLRAAPSQRLGSGR